MTELKTVHRILSEMWSDNYKGSNQSIKNDPDAPVLQVIHNDDYENKINIEIYSEDYRIISLEQDIYKVTYNALDGRRCAARFMHSLVIEGERSKHREVVEVAGNARWLIDLTEKLSELVKIEMPLLEKFKNLPPLDEDLYDNF